MSQPLISVIIPTYNASAYLSRCLDSVLSQTYTNIEVVAVDDGSTDNTASVLRGYAEKDARVRVITQSNAGVSATRNAGLNTAKGEYLFFADCDDWLSPDALECLYKASDGVDIVQGVHVCAYDDGSTEAVDVAGEILTDTSAILQSYFLNHVQEACWNKLFRRAVIGDVRFDETLAVSEDSKFVYEVLQRSSGVRLVSEATYYYYMRSDSCVHAALADKHFAVLTLRDQQYEEIRDEAVRQVFVCKYVQDVFHLIHCILQDTGHLYRDRLPQLRKRVLRVKDLIVKQPLISSKLKALVLLLWMAPPVFYWVYRKIRANESIK